MSSPEHLHPPLLALEAPPDAHAVDRPLDRQQPKKKRDKVRSAWISFIGRILAQLVGAAATVGLGFAVLHRYQAPSSSRTPASVQAPRAPAAALQHRTGPAALAVLPLQDFSGVPAPDSFADGMTEALITDLARVPSVRVISRTSSMRFKNARSSLPAIAQELGADVIVEGSLVRSGERVRVTVQLIDGRTDEHLFARVYDRTWRDVLRLQSDVARAVASDIDVTLKALPRRVQG